MTRKNLQHIKIKPEDGRPKTEENDRRRKRLCKNVPQPICQFKYIGSEKQLQFSVLLFSFTVCFTIFIW